MNIEEEKKEKLLFMQHFFVKSFWISFIFLLIASFLCVAMHNYQAAFVAKYFPISANDLNLIILLTMGIWKVLIFQFTLVPAIAIFCIRHCPKCCGCGKK